MWKTIYNKLRDKGLNPYPPGKHSGLCEANYCVVKDGSQIPNFRTNRLGQKVMDLILFVPLNSYITIEPYAKDIRAAMKEIENLRKTGTETPPIVDDTKEAYTMSIEYVIQKKLEG